MHKTIITINNSGVSFARNVGLINCSGQYITFVDGDDTIEPEFLEKAVFQLDNYDYDFVQGNYDLVFKEHFEYPLSKTNSNIIVDSRTRLLELFLMPKHLIYDSVWGKGYKAEIACKLKFDISLKVAEDKKFVVDIISNSQKAIIMEDVAYHYFQRKPSAIHNIDEGGFNNKLYVWEYIKKNCNYNSFSNNINIHELYIYIHLYKAELKKKNSGNKYYKYIKETYSVVRLHNEGVHMRLEVLLLVHARCVFNSIFRLKQRIFVVI